MLATERRRNRSRAVPEALRFQLDACRDASRLDGMILADADGLCLAASGDGLPHDEIAVQVALLAGKVENFEGVLYAPDAQWNVRVRRFEAEGNALMLCAVGGGGEPRAASMHRGISGVTRILSC